MSINIINTKPSQPRARRLLQAPVRKFYLLVTLLILAGYAPHARAGTLWVRKGPVFHSNGLDSKPKSPNVSVDDTSLAASGGEGKTNKITWSLPPETLTDGDDVVLTINSTTNSLPLVLGHWSASDAGERNATVSDGAAASWPQGKTTGASYSSGKTVFKFQPEFTPTLTVIAGKWDDFSGDSTVSVTWTYEVGTVPTVAEGNKLLLGMRIAQRDNPAKLDYTGQPLPIDVNVFAAGKSQPGAGKSSHVDFSYDGKLVNSGQTDETGGIEFKMTLPGDTPAGRSNHKFKVVAGKEGFAPAEKTLDIEINRSGTPIVVDASASGTQFKAGDDVVITGFVYYRRFALITEPVKAAIRVVVSGGDDAQPLAATTTDDRGYFNVTIPIIETPLSGDKRYWKVNALPFESVFSNGGKELEFGVEPGQSLNTTVLTDKAVYATTDTIRVSGNVTSNRTPVPGAGVSLRVQRSQTDPPQAIVTVPADANGHYESTFPVTDLAPKTNSPISVVDEGYYLILARADTRGYTQLLDSQAYVAVQENTAKCPLQEFEVGAVAGEPSTIHTPNLNPSLFNGPVLLKQGARLTQGSVLTTKGNDKVALVMPFGDGAAVQVTLRGETTLRIASFCKGANGRVKLRILVSNPAQISLQTINPGVGAAPLDYQIITPTAVINSVRTRYRITVDRQGVTTVVTEEGEVLVTPANTSLRPLSVPAVQQVRIGPNSVGPVQPVAAGGNASGGGATGGGAKGGGAGGRKSTTAGGTPNAQLSGLSGLWVDDTGRGGVYRLRQVGSQLYWSLDATAKGSFANLFHGEISGDTINGEWVDMPGSPNLGGGSMTLRIESNDRLVKVNSSSLYGAKAWTRRGSRSAAAGGAPGSSGGAGGGAAGNTGAGAAGAGGTGGGSSGGAGPAAGTGDASNPQISGLSGLSGLWVDDTGGGGIYRLRQIGNTLYWGIDATSKGSFANLYRGEISGNSIKGEWQDMPGSPSLGGGTLTLRIESNDRLVKVSSSSFYGAQEWRRKGASGSGGTSTSAGNAACTGDKIDWNYDFRNTPRDKIGQRYNLCCAGNPVIPNNVCGTDIYADASAVCTSALHAGVITQAGGPVSLELVNGLPEYRTSARNGVPAGYCNGRDMSFRFIAGAGKPGDATSLAAGVLPEGAAPSFGDLDQLRARIAALDSVRTQIRALITSDSQHADDAAQAENAGRQSLALIKALRPRLEAYGNFCRKFANNAAEVESGLVSTHNSATRIERLADEASRLAAKCDSADEAAVVKGKLNEAFKLQAEIIKQETLIRNATTALERGSSSFDKLGGPYNLDTAYRELSTQVVDAEAAARASEADFARAQQLSAKLSRDTRKISDDLTFLKQKYTRGAGGAFSNDLQQRFAYLEGQVAILETPVRLGEYQLTARNKANGVAGYLQQASDIFDLAKHNLCEGLVTRFNTALEAITNIETVTELTLDAAATSSGDCLKNAGGLSNNLPKDGEPAGPGAPGKPVKPKPPVVEQLPEDGPKVAKAGNLGRGGIPPRTRTPVDQNPEGAGRPGLQALGKCSAVIDLVGRESVPAQPYGGWTWNEGNITAPPYNGVQTFRWTQPAQRMGPEGFQMTLNVMSKSNPNSRANGGIHVAGDFNLSPNPPGMEALSENEQAVSKSLTVYVKPGPNPSGDLYLRVGADYGPGYSYHYKVVDNGCPSSTRTNTGSAGGRNPSVAGKWILESVTVSPETPYSPWTYSAQSSSAHYGLYNGDQADFHWTVPPRQIDGNGFTMSVGITGTPAPNSRIASIIGVTETGFTSDIPRDQQGVSVLADGSSKSDQKSMTFKPAPSASELEIKVSFQWAISFTYKYRKAP